VDKEDPRKFARVHQSAQLYESEKGNKRDGDDDRDQDHAEESVAPGRFDALGDSFAMEDSNQHLLDNIENEENDSEQDRPQQDWIDQGSSAPPLAKAKVVGHQHDLREHQSIEETDAELRKGNMVLRQDDILMNLKEDEHRPEIGKHRSEPCKFMKSSGLQVRLRVGHVACPHSAGHRTGSRAPVWTKATAPGEEHPSPNLKR
jgi:hypothetical protein